MWFFAVVFWRLELFPWPHPEWFPLFQCLDGLLLGCLACWLPLLEIFFFFLVQLLKSMLTRGLQKVWKMWFMKKVLIDFHFLKPKFLGFLISVGYTIMCSVLVCTPLLMVCWPLMFSDLCCPFRSLYSKARPHHSSIQDPGEEFLGTFPWNVGYSSAFPTKDSLRYSQSKWQPLKPTSRIWTSLEKILRREIWDVSWWSLPFKKLKSWSGCSKHFLKILQHGQVRIFLYPTWEGDTLVISFFSC